MPRSRRWWRGAPGSSGTPWGHRGPRREQQVAEGGGRHPEAARDGERHRRRGREPHRPRRRRRLAGSTVAPRRARSRGPSLEERKVRCTGHQELALRVDEVAHELVASVRRVCPTTVAPARAAAWSQKTNSAELSESTATWNGPSPRCSASHAARAAASATTSQWRQLRCAVRRPGRSSSARASTSSAMLLGPGTASPPSLQMRTRCKIPLCQGPRGQLEASESSQLAHRKGTASEKLPPP